MKTITFGGYTFDLNEGHVTIRRGKIDYTKDGDYGTDPIFDDDGNPTGLVRLHPSGRVVTVEESRVILGRE